MAAPRITQEQVFKTADELKQQGEHPSVAAVREAIGSGSYSTVNRYLQLWREQQEKDMVSVDLPAPVEEAYRKAAAIAWAEASRVAGEQVAIVKEKAEQEQQRREEEARDAAAEIERLEQQAGQVEPLQARVQELTEQLTRLEAENRQLSEQRTTQAEDLKAANEKISTLSREIGTLEGRLQAPT